MFRLFLALATTKLQKKDVRRTKNEDFFCNFAAMNVKTKRQIASWVLLAVYLPMLFVSLFHIHETSLDDGTTCVECVQHQCHGHLTQLSDGMHQCVLCQFLTLSYVATAIGVVAFYLSPRRISYALRSQSTCLTACGIISLRAPPAV